MPGRTATTVASLSILLALAAFPTPAQPPPPGADGFETAEGVVTELYDLVTFEAGTTPDWDRVRALFVDQAVSITNELPTPERPLPAELRD